MEALKKEILLYSDFSIKLETLYFGGGTPTVLNPEVLGEIISFLKDNFYTEKEMEITVEANPNTYRFEDFSILKAYGVNRLSIGAQSFINKNLKSLGRDHSPEDTYECLEDSLKAGIDNINIDLIFGIEGQTLKDLQKDIDIYTSLPVKHISAYMLTAYEETPLGQKVKSGLYSLPDENMLEEMYIAINEGFRKKGFKRYEISNWSKNGFQCKHNLFYWKHVEFLGFGISAWSFVKNERFGNTPNLSGYFKKLEKGEKPIFFREKLSQEELNREKIILGLRLEEGVEINLVKGKEKEIHFLLEGGFIRINKDKISLTEKGVLVSNYVINKLID